ncbi:MAG: helix-turn-helix transcriptional regulator [Lachnospiraceae bacterium]|nr:helix-turn-helix transcriptional regulator [Lachnospiraceae bacterium]
MDLVKMGAFLKELRKEKDITQEQLAEEMGVARRTVSRWETGANMPDMDILIDISDFYKVDLREILDGERKNEQMDKEMKETVLKVAEYENEGKKRTAVVVIVYSALGIAALLANLIMNMVDMPDTFLTGTLKGLTVAIALGAMVLGIVYATGTLTKLYMFKKRMFESRKKG